MKRFFPWLILIALTVLTGLTLLLTIEGLTKSISYSSEITLPEKKTVSVVLVGDTMLNRGVEYMIKNEGDGDFRFPFLKIAEDLKGVNLLFGNLEGPISDKGIKVGSIYSFRNDPKTIEGLTFAGFDVISLANNHVFDYGREALEDTFLRLKTAGIDYVGAGFNEGEAYGESTPVIKEIEGTKIGFLAYTNLGPETWKAVGENSGMAWISEEDIDYNPPTTSSHSSLRSEWAPRIKNDIKAVKEKADILIVSFHSGEEYLSEPTQFQIEFSKAAIEAGADIVIGHHPHVIQKSEQYQSGYIFYSLGNFVFDQSFSEETQQGQMVKILIKNGKIKEVIPEKIEINNYFQPEIATEEEQ